MAILIVLITGCDLFNGVLSSDSIIKVENHTNQDITGIVVKQGDSVKKIDTNCLVPAQSQEYCMSEKTEYTVAVYFVDGSTISKSVNVTEKEEVVLRIGRELSYLK